MLPASLQRSDARPRSLALLTMLLAFVASPVAAQNWSVDARRIALGSIGDMGHVASELVAEQRGYGSIVVPFGLFQILADFSIYDPEDDHFDPVRAAEYIASPLHYTFDRNGSDSGQQFVNDIVNGRLNPNLNVYRGFQPANEFVGEGLASPSWGKTFTVREDGAGAFHGVYVGAGPYLSVRTDNMIDQELITLLWWNRVLRRAPERPRLDRIALNADVSRVMVDAGFG